MLNIQIVEAMHCEFASKCVLGQMQVCVFETFCAWLSHLQSFILCSVHSQFQSVMIDGEIIKQCIDNVGKRDTITNIQIKEQCILHLCDNSGRHELVAWDMHLGHAHVL